MCLLLGVSILDQARVRTCKYVIPKQNSTENPTEEVPSPLERWFLRYRARKIDKNRFI